MPAESSTRSRSAAGSPAPLSDADRGIIEAAEGGLRRGVELLRWWKKVDAANSYTDTYPETFIFNRPEDTSMGFFERAPLEGGEIPVIGNVQQMFYDQPKPGGSRRAAAEGMRRQVREFVLRYFMRVSDFRRPQPVPEEGHPELPPLLRYFSRCPTGEYQTSGFGYSQVFYKRRASGETGRFEEDTRDAIIDLRELCDRYEWIVVENPIRDFGFDFRPLGLSGPLISIPVPASNYLALSRDTITLEENPADGVLGRYGLGYAYLDTPGDPSPLAYGPGQLDPGFQLLVWEVRSTGEVLVRMTFCSRAPERLLNLSLNPVRWSFAAADLATFGMTSRLLAPVKKTLDDLPFADVSLSPVLTTARLANLLTANMADKYFCVSVREIEKELLYLHFLKHYQAVLGSVQTWRQIADWTEPAKLPEWVKTGVSA